MGFLDQISRVNLRGLRYYFRLIQLHYFILASCSMLLYKLQKNITTRYSYCYLMLWPLFLIWIYGCFIGSKWVECSQSRTCGKCEKHPILFYRLKYLLKKTTEARVYWNETDDDVGNSMHIKWLFLRSVRYCKNFVKQ